MKIALTLMFLLLFGISYTQIGFARAYTKYGQDGSGTPAHAKLNNRHFTLHDRYYTATQIGTLKLAEFNEEGDMVFEQELPSALKSNARILGFFRKSSTELIYLLQDGLGGNQLWYFGTINVNTWANTESVFIVQNVKPKISDFIQKGDSLIALVLGNDNKMKRLSFNTFMPLQHTLVTVDDLGSGFSMGNFKVGLTADDAGNEYYFENSNRKIYQRSAAGIIKKAAPAVNGLLSRSMAANNTGVFVATTQGIFKFNVGLDSVGFYDLTGQVNSAVSESINIIGFNGDVFCAFSDAYDLSTFLQLSSSFNIIDKKKQISLNRMRLSKTNQEIILQSDMRVVISDAYEKNGVLNSSPFLANNRLDFISVFTSVDKMKKLQDFSFDFKLNDS